MQNGWHSADDYWTRKNHRRVTVNGIDIGTGIGIVMVYIHLIQNISTHIYKMICTTIEFLLKRNNINGTNGTDLADWEKANDWANEKKIEEKKATISIQHRTDIVKAYIHTTKRTRTVHIMHNTEQYQCWRSCCFSYKCYIFFILSLSLCFPLFLSSFYRCVVVLVLCRLFVVMCFILYNAHTYSIYLSICLSIYLYLAG